MRLIVTGTLMFALTGCQAFDNLITPPGGGGKGFITDANGRVRHPLAFDVEQMLSVGGAFAVLNDTGEEATVTIVNENNAELVKTFTVPASTQRFEIMVDPDHMPGLERTDAVQTFKISAATKLLGTDTYIKVVSEKDVLPIPNVAYQRGGSEPPTFNPQGWVIADDTADADSFIKLSAADWKGANVTFGSKLIGASVADIPPQFQGIPDKVKLREYIVRGTFPKYLILEPYSQTGKAVVMAPKALRFVVAQTIPTKLISLKALPD